MKIKKKLAKTVRKLLSVSSSLFKEPTDKKCAKNYK